MAGSCYRLCRSNQKSPRLELPDSVQLWNVGTQVKDKQTHHESSSSILPFCLFVVSAVTGAQYDGTVREYFVRGYHILQFLQCGNVTWCMF